jgi:hypothetical protein
LPHHATLLDGSGNRVSLGELTDHGTSILTLVSSGCPGCTLRMEELAHVRPQPGLRVVFVRLDGPGARPLRAGDGGAGRSRRSDPASRDQSLDARRACLGYLYLYEYGRRPR